MATVTGLTAERMQEIIDKTIVDADVVGGNLILTLEDETTINAGAVTGPQGPQGPAGPAYTLVGRCYDGAGPSPDQVIAYNTATLINLVEYTDPQGWHDPAVNPARVTPNVAGKFLVMAQCGFYENQATPTGGRVLDIYKNSTIWKSAGTNHLPPNTKYSLLNTQVIVDLNGTTDYVAMSMYQDSAVGNSLTIRGGIFSSFTVVHLGT